MDGRYRLRGHYLFSASIYLVVTSLAVNDRAKAFKTVSAGMLPPLGILFALLVDFIVRDLEQF